MISIEKMLRRLRILPHRWRLTLVFKSGAKVTFTCRQYERVERGDELTKLRVEDAPRWPLFVSLGDVACIEKKRTWL